jgi:hypothetical protein
VEVLVEHVDLVVVEIGDVEECRAADLVTFPASEAKMKTDRPLVTPLLITKSAVFVSTLNTCPVGAPPKMLVGLNGTLVFTRALVTPVAALVTSPLYKVVESPPLDDTQKAPPVALREIPQALIRLVSTTGAMPGWSATRSVAR